MFDHLNIINHTLLLAVGKSDLFLKLELIKKPVYIAILFAAIPFGVLGICISKIISAQAAVIMNTYYTGKLFKFGYFAQLKDFSPYFIYSIISCLPAFLFSFLDFPEIISILFGCITAPILYWLMLRKDENMCEIINITSGYIKNIRK